MFNVRKKKDLFLILISVMLVVTACGSTGEQPAEEPSTPEIPTVVFADAGWDSHRLHNAIAQFVFENGYDIDTDVMPGSSVNLIEGIAAGDVHIKMEMWQDNLPTYRAYREEGKILELATNFDDNKQGIYVPRYMIEGDAERGIEPMTPDLKNLEDLAKYADLFPDLEDPGRSRILNGPPGWEVTGIVEVKFATYGLDEIYNVVGAGSSASLMASAAGAYEKGQPWVGYLWEPTWITGMYDFVLLEEEPFDIDLWNAEGGYACAFKSVDVVVAASPILEEAYPAAVEFLRHYETSSALTSAALSYILDNDASIEEAAEWFLVENEDLWKNWLPEENYQKVMDALQ
jgi:glycine betaine/proline transport system substrate-binding protein